MRVGPRRDIGRSARSAVDGRLAEVDRYRPRHAHGDAPVGAPPRPVGAPPRRGPAVSRPTGNRAAPVVPPHRGAYSRPAVIAGFWAILGTSVGLWVVNTPIGSVSSPGALVTAAGRVAGMVGGALLVVEVLMTSRVSLLEGWVGARDLMRWHRQTGVAVVVAIVAHTGLIIVGYALTTHTSVPAQAWTMLTTLEDVGGAFAATGILVAVALLSIQQARQRLRYELWHFLHLAMYLVLLLAYGHQIALGGDLESPMARDLWMGLYVLTIACLAWGRVIAPTMLNLRHRLRVAEVLQESPDTFSIYISGRHLTRLQAQPGQFFRWRFLTPGGWWQSHPFSLSRAPNRHWLRLTVQSVGDHTRQLRLLRPGTRILAEGPFGTFTAERRTRDRALLIAGGSGIAPIRALLDRMPDGSILIYRASRARDLVFTDELERLAGQRHVRIHYVLGPRDDPANRRVFTPVGLARLVPDVRHRDTYLCGPPGLVATAVRTLHRLRVPSDQIHLDPFEF